MMLSRPPPILTAQPCTMPKVPFTAPWAQVTLNNTIIGYHRIPSDTIRYRRPAGAPRAYEPLPKRSTSGSKSKATGLDRQLDSISNNMLHTKGRRVSKNLKPGSRCDRRISAMPQVLILVHT